MGLVFERVMTEGIALLSYLVGDDASGTAAVIDPRPDADIYLELARKRKLSITHIFETHIHADFLSGSRELAARAGGAEIHVSHEGGAKYGFDHRPVRDGDCYEFGSLLLTAQFTPGHTPEHLSFLAAEKTRRDDPWGVFSGDALFVSSAGRPDLLGQGQAEKLAEQLYDTLYDFYLKLDDAVIVHPAHGHGSPCGAEIGDRLETTIGYERRHNPFLQFSSREELKRHALSTAPPEPTYYKRMKKLNAEGPEVWGGTPTVAALSVGAFKEALDAGRGVLVDTRSMLAFGGGHIPGAVNIGADPELSIWAGWMLDPQKPILLVMENDSDLERVVPLFWRSGFTSFAGYLAGGMKAWNNAGLPVGEMDQITVHEIQNRRDGMLVLDVRSPGEWQEGHIPGAKHLFLPEIPKRLGELDKNQPVAVHCNSGYRASLAASLLQNHGFRDVRNVPGSWQAWTKAGYPVEK